MNTYKLYTDGSFQPDLNIAGIGGYLLDPENRVICTFSERVTNPLYFKFHESIALTHGLNMALKRGISRLECFSDDRSIRNVFNQPTLSLEAAATNPLRQEIFSLKEQFEVIHFHHLARIHNKKADKLAGEALRVYKNDVLPHRGRAYFADKGKKLLYTPKLLCEEDFEQDTHTFENMLHSVNQYYIFDVLKDESNPYPVEDFSSVGEQPLIMNTYLVTYDSSTKNLQHSTLIRSDNFEVKELFSQGLDILTNALEQIPNKNTIGIMFNAAKPLQRIDMVLRRRGTLHNLETPLIQKFLNTTPQYENIILHTIDDLIMQNTLFHQSNTYVKKRKI
jgi:ribonuclease HI